MKFNHLSSCRAALGALLFILTAPAPAQNVPEIVWSTNGQDFLYGVNFSADGRFLATAGDDSLVKVWSVADRTLVRTFSVVGPAALCVALSPDGSLVAAGDGDGKTRVWRVDTGDRLWIGGPNNQLARSMAFSPDGALLAIGRTDGINVLCAEAGVGIPFGEPEGEVFGVQFARDGSLLASANANNCRPSAVQFTDRQHLRLYTTLS